MSKLTEKLERLEDMYPQSGTLGGFHDSDTQKIWVKTCRIMNDFVTNPIQYEFHPRDAVKLKSIIPTVHSSHANGYGRGYVAFLRKSVVSSRTSRN